MAEVREAGLNIMMSMKGDGKPVSFIEDCAVALPDLADYTERLNDVFARHGTKGTWYAHASVGCLHVRPVLNMKDPRRRGEDARDRRGMLRAWSASTRAATAASMATASSASEFNEPMFGRRIARAFEQVKDAFDPAGLLNPGRVVRPPRMDDRSLFRYGPDYAADAERHAGARLVRLARPARRPAGRGRDVQQQRHLPEIRCRRRCARASARRATSST